MTEKEIKEYYQISKYFITAIRPILFKKENKIHLDFINSNIRLLGWYNTLKEAQEHITSNCMDISEEGYYKYIVVEQVPKGIVPLSRIVCWYKWTNKYIKCRQPSWAKNTINWSIG
ncbi:MAG: hypothetical protein M0R17_05000 [Candidatus Omnitrophica bacterium]|jgi:hypothetical protein|nr:hypothetical protein [Candidatus Omnitrophota bacterium]